jgi:hypothetical protein
LFGSAESFQQLLQKAGLVSPGPAFPCTCVAAQNQLGRLSETVVHAVLKLDSRQRKQQRFLWLYPGFSICTFWIPAHSCLFQSQYQNRAGNIGSETHSCCEVNLLYRLTENRRSKSKRAFSKITVQGARVFEGHTKLIER